MGDLAHALQDRPAAGDPGLPAAGSLPQEAQPWLLGLQLFAPGPPTVRVTCFPSSVLTVHAHLESTFRAQLDVCSVSRCLDT